MSSERGTLELPSRQRMRFDLVMAGWRNAGTDMWCSPFGVHLAGLAFCWGMMWRVGPNGKRVNRG